MSWPQEQALSRPLPHGTRKAFLGGAAGRKGGISRSQAKRGAALINTFIS